MGLSPVDTVSNYAASQSVYGTSLLVFCSSPPHNSGREIMPEEMRIHGLGELGGTARLGAQTGDTHAGDGLGDAVPRKEPGAELIEHPVAPQQWEQVGGEHHEAIAFALALAHVDHHPLGFDVGALELTEVGDADARG